MNSQALIFDRARLSSASRGEAAACRKAACARPGRWEIANFVLVLASILVAVTILSVKLAGAEPCFQSPAGKCLPEAQAAAQGPALPASRATAPATEAGLAL